MYLRAFRPHGQAWPRPRPRPLVATGSAHLGTMREAGRQVGAGEDDNALLLAAWWQAAQACSWALPPQASCAAAEGLRGG